MKITKTQLKQSIREDIKTILDEGFLDRFKKKQKQQAPMTKLEPAMIQKILSKHPFWQIEYRNSKKPEQWQPTQVIKQLEALIENEKEREREGPTSWRQTYPKAVSREGMKRLDPDQIKIIGKKLSRALEAVGERLKEPLKTSDLQNLLAPEPPNELTDWKGDVADLARAFFEIWDTATTVISMEAGYLTYVNSWEYKRERGEAWKEREKKRYEKRGEEEASRRRSDAYRKKQEKGWTINPKTGELEPGGDPTGLSTYYRESKDQTKMKLTKSQLRNIIRETIKEVEFHGEDPSGQLYGTEKEDARFRQRLKAEKIMERARLDQNEMDFVFKAFRPGPEAQRFVESSAFEKLLSYFMETEMIPYEVAKDADADYWIIDYLSGNEEGASLAAEQKSRKITKSQLLKVIREELYKVFYEKHSPGRGGDVVGDGSVEVEAKSVAMAMKKVQDENPTFHTVKAEPVKKEKDKK